MMYGKDYSYYKFSYGGTMSAEDFVRFGRQAAAYLDQVTFGRIQTVTDEELQIRTQDACCSLADELLLNEQGGGIASETNDGVSVTYMNKYVPETVESRLYKIALRYLGHSGLMYRGVE